MPLTQRRVLPGGALETWMPVASGSVQDMDIGLKTTGGREGTAGSKSSSLCGLFYCDATREEPKSYWFVVPMTRHEKPVPIEGSYRLAEVVTPDEVVCRDATGCASDPGQFIRALQLKYDYDSDLDEVRGLIPDSDEPPPTDSAARLGQAIGHALIEQLSDAGEEIRVVPFRSEDGGLQIIAHAFSSRRRVIADVDPDGLKVRVQRMSPSYMGPERVYYDLGWIMEAAGWLKAIR